MRISACYIVKDEAEELRRSLEGVKGQADEIIVVQTVESQAVHQAAEQAGARLFYFAWQDDFAAARNFALAQATGDWLLLLDADEYFTEETAGNLRKVVEAHREVEGLLVPLTNLGQQGEDMLTAPALRLARRQPGLKYVGRIHEELCVGDKILEDVQILTEKELHILHTGYRPEVNKSKAERNLRLLRQELRERQSKNEAEGSLYMYLAEACYGLGQAREAEHWARLDIAQGRRKVLYASRSHHILLSLLAKQSRPEDRLQAAERASQDFPELAEFRAELAACRAAWGDFAGASAELAQAMELAGRPSGFEPQHFGTAEAEQAEKQLQVWRDLAEEAETLDLSVCMIMKDEVQELPAWLANAQTYAKNKEIIIVDTGSQDGSRELADQAGVRLYDFLWRDDFAAAKNFALEQVIPVDEKAFPYGEGGPRKRWMRSSDNEAKWIIFLDADETFYHPEGVRGLLVRAIRRHPEAQGFQVLMRHVDTDAADLPIGTEPVIRILRQQRGLGYQGRVHEVPSLHGEILAGLPLAEGLILRHTGYASSKVRAKARRNLRLLRQQEERPQDYRYLADACYALERYDEALHYARLALASGWQGLDSNKSLYGTVLHSLMRLRHPLSEQLTLLGEARQSFPQAADFLAWQGLLLWQLGKLPEAGHLLNSALQAGRTAELEPMLAKVRAVLGMLSLERGQREQAEAELAEALGWNPFERMALELAARLWPEPEAWVEHLRPFYQGEAMRRQFLPQLGRWAAEAGQLSLLLYVQRLRCEEGQSVPETELCAAYARHEQDVGRALFLQIAQDMQRLFVACLQLSRPRDGMEAEDIPHECLELLPAELRQVAEAWQSGEALPPEAGGSYATGLDIVMAGQAVSLYERYAALGLELAPARQRESADKFFRQRAWAAAFALYQALPADETGEPGSFWHHLGVTLYHLGEYGAVEECLARAEAAGSREPDMAAYRKWAREQLS
ncbi:glycosyltransferase family 2 protein [Selenomonas sp. KH1T6]|uniref:glycosyltransferase family 2 protein n=1 Tax=Selenomonas sp. KH1T6 TaxID=3158784 RepID=UPI0008A7F628|nr:Glycosyltransferase involved in cell wall bisynthesis [Selenomonas ruminantium]